jgi:hypothetical protein
MASAHEKSAQRGRPLPAVDGRRTARAGALGESGVGFQVCSFHSAVANALPRPPSRGLRQGTRASAAPGSVQGARETGPRENANPYKTNCIRQTCPSQTWHEICVAYTYPILMEPAACKGTKPGCTGTKSGTGESWHEICFKHGAYFPGAMASSPQDGTRRAPPAAAFARRAGAC